LLAVVAVVVVILLFLMPEVGAVLEVIELPLELAAVAAVLNLL
jgi:hypothetical protein